MEVLSTEGVSKRFGSSLVLDEISIHLQQGEIYGFLGLNGAGKTTLIRMLLGMIRPDKGKIFLFGKPLTTEFDQWNKIGYLVESAYAYPNLSVLENLQVYYKLRQLSEPALIMDIIEQLHLRRFIDTPAKFLSLGNQQRLGLAKALMHHPRLLLLDEPTNGLDPEGIIEVRQLLLNLARKGCTIFLSSHILSEIAKMTHRIGIIHEGKLVNELTQQELNNQLIKKLVVSTSDNQKAMGVLGQALYNSTLSIQ